MDMTGDFAEGKERERKEGSLGRGKGTEGKGREGWEKNTPEINLSFTALNIILITVAHPAVRKWEELWIHD